MLTRSTATQMHLPLSRSTQLQPCSALVQRQQQSMPLSMLRALLTLLRLRTLRWLIQWVRTCHRRAMCQQRRLQAHLQPALLLHQQARRLYLQPQRSRPLRRQPQHQRARPLRNNRQLLPPPRHLQLLRSLQLELPKQHQRARPLRNHRQPLPPPRHLQLLRSVQLELPTSRPQLLLGCLSLQRT